MQHKSGITFCQKAFQVQSIACNIINYLDFESKTACKTVCISWLYDLYQSASNHVLDMNNLFQASHNECSKCTKLDVFQPNYQDKLYCEEGRSHHLRIRLNGAIQDLPIFRNVRDLTIPEWPAKLNHYFKNWANQLKKIAKITIHQNAMYLQELYEDDDHICDQQYSSTVLDILKNNSDTIKSINIGDEWDEDTCGTRDSLSRILCQLENIKFSQLQELRIHYCALNLRDCQEITSILNCFTNIKVSGSCNRDGDNEKPDCETINIICLQFMTNVFGINFKDKKKKRKKRKKRKKKFQSPTIWNIKISV